LPQEISPDEINKLIDIEISKQEKRIKKVKGAKTKYLTIKEKLFDSCNKFEKELSETEE